MKKKLIAIVVSLLLMFCFTIPVYAGPGGGNAPPPIPPIPTSIGICQTILLPDDCTTYDDNDCNCLLPDNSETYYP